jgi:hypothetical protein
MVVERWYFSVGKNRKYYLDQRSPTDGQRENFGGPWRNVDIICNVYVYYTVSLYYYIISNKQQQISH